MIAGILDWTNQADNTSDLLRMQQEIGPFPVGKWDSCRQAGSALSASSLEQSGASGIARRASKDQPTALLARRAMALTVTFDGTLYNRDELIQSLRDDPDWDASGGDADLVLAAYRRWGRDLVDHLIGDFALAVWDGLAGTLFAAVDPFGLRPFYFAVSGGRLAFASRMSQLRILPWVGNNLNDRMIVSFLLEKWQDPFSTFFSQIQQLPPGHWLWADGTRLTARRYWQPGIQNVCQATRPEEVLQEFADRFRLAVRQRLPLANHHSPLTTHHSPTSVGILMSGGLDSTAMAGMVADIYRREPSTVPSMVVITALFGDLPCDESKYIEAALRRLPFPSRQFDGRGGPYTLDDLTEDMRRHEWPVLHRQGPLFMAFREAARLCGARILLNGLGGDELTTDYRYYKVPMKRGNPLGILRAAHLVRQVERMSLGKSLYLLAQEACPEEVKRPYRWVRRRFRQDPPPAWYSWLSPDFRKIAEDLESEPPAPSPEFGSDTLELAWRTLTAPRASWANRFLVDEFASAGITCRFPFLDRRLFDFVFSIPTHLRPRCQGRPWFKPFISQGLASFLPPEIRLRDAKVDFGAYNCYVFELCLEFLRPCLFDGPWKSEGFVPRSQAQGLFDSYIRPKQDWNHQTNDEIKRMETLRNIAGLELWLRDIQK
jgi:asparagine synthase (glutamine-hydrolysing)